MQTASHFHANDGAEMSYQTGLIEGIGRDKPFANNDEKMCRAAMLFFQHRA